VNTLSDLFEKLFTVMAAIAALLLFAMVVIITTDIVLRNVFVSGFPWANEVSEYALYLITMLTAPWLLRKGQHVRLDLVLNAIPTRFAWILEAIGDIVGFIVCVAMVRFGMIMALEAWNLGSITIKILVFPEWWLLAPLPFSFLLLAIEFIFRFLRLMKSRTVREEATSVA
jgi:TRAP-type C4-dicarboxylate transport system permease small subunit